MTLRQPFPIVLAATLALATADSAAAQTPSKSTADGPWIGAWRLNPAKTAEANGAPPPASEPATDTIFRMVAVGRDAFKYTMERVPRGASGPGQVSAELIGRFDGKDYIEIGNPNADTNRFRILDSRSYEVIDTKDGVDLITIRVTVSEDGRTRTSVAKGKTAAGAPVSRTSVYERVP